MSGKILTAVTAAAYRSTSPASGREAETGGRFAMALGEAVASAGDAGEREVAAAGAPHSAEAAKSSSAEAASSEASFAEASAAKGTAAGGGAGKTDAADADGGETGETDRKDEKKEKTGEADGVLMLLAAGLPVVAAALAAQVKTAAVSGDTGEKTGGGTVASAGQPAVEQPSGTAAPSEPLPGMTGGVPVQDAQGPEPKSRPAGDQTAGAADVSAADEAAGGRASFPPRPEGAAPVPGRSERMDAEAAPAVAFSASTAAAAVPAGNEAPAAGVPAAGKGEVRHGWEAAAFPTEIQKETRTEKGDSPAAAVQSAAVSASGGAFAPAAAHMAAVPAAPEEGPRLARQVARQIASALPGDGSLPRTQLRLHLSPADLGGINLCFATENGRVTLQITADNSRTGALLAAHLEDLSRSLAQSGVTMDHTEVFCQPGTAGGQSGAGGWQGAPPGFTGHAGADGGGHGGRQTQGEAFPLGQPAAAAPPAKESAPLRTAPGRMSLFA